jgi:hypothetical protein
MKKNFRNCYNKRKKLAAKEGRKFAWVLKDKFLLKKIHKLQLLDFLEKSMSEREIL